MPFELALPRQCAGCKEPGEILCSRCRTLLASPPTRVSTAATPLAPVYACGAYGGPHREVIVAMKDRHNRAVRPYIGAVVRAAVRHLQAQGELSHRVVLVPAPTRWKSARLRGGDPISDICRHSQYPVHHALSLAAKMPDQSSLGKSERLNNVRGHIRLQAAVPANSELVVVDDVVTTGATLVASVDMLTFAGGRVCACLVLAAA